MASYVQTSFSGGLWSLSMQGNTTRPDYRTAMSECLNGISIDTGAWVRRSGTKTGGFTRQAKPAKLLRFDFQESSPYNMEFTDGYVRFWNGTTPAFTNDAQSISSVSTANPAVVTTASAHGWTTGNGVRFTIAGTISPLLQACEFAITVLSMTTFSIADAVTGAAIDGSTLAWVAGATATVSRILEYPTVYTSGTWGNLRSVQTEKQSVLLNGSQIPQILTQVIAPSLASDPAFSIVPSNFLDGPYLDPYPGSYATPSALSGNIAITLSFQIYDATKAYSIGEYSTSVGVGYKSLQSGNLNNTPASSPTFWVAVSSGDPIGVSGVVPSDVGRHVRLYSEPATWVALTAYATGNLVEYLGTYWIALVASTGSIPGNDATKWSVAANASLWTWGRILSASGAGGVSGATGSPVGTMTVGGGMSSAFDGTNTKAAAGSAESNTNWAPGQSSSDYVGKNFTGAAQAIQQVVVYPSSDAGYSIFSPPNYPNMLVTTLNLRGKATAPASASDGVLLGTSGPFANSTVSKTIPSSDTATAWNYVWVEIIVASDGYTPTYFRPCISQIIFSNPNSATGSVFTLQIAGPALLYATTVRTWRFGAYSNTTGWPKCGTYHEGRLWLSGAVPNRVDASKSNDIFNFAPTETNGTVTGASGIAYRFNSPDVNAIFWMEPDQQGIICGTQAGEWLVQATSTNQALTAANMQAHRVTRIKCANIEPRRTEHTIVFAQKNTRRLMEYFADVYSGKFASPNLSISAKHLIPKSDSIAEIAYQQDNMPIVWVRTTLGKLIGLSYRRESLLSREGPTVCAWHRHTLGSAYAVTSIVSGPSIDRQRDALSMVVLDGAGRYRVSSMQDIMEETDAVTANWLLDDAVAPTSYAVQGSNLVLNGLYAQNGSTMTVWAAGLDCGDYSIANGTVSVPLGDGITAGTGNGLLTAAYINSFATMPIVCGFTYVSRGQMVRPATQAETGTRDGPGFGKVRRSQEFAAQLVNTLGISFGTVFGKLRKAQLASPAGVYNSPLQPFSGILQAKLEDTYTFDSMLTWEITRPYPAMVVAAGAYLETQDR